MSPPLFSRKVRSEMFEALSVRVPLSERPAALPPVKELRCESDGCMLHVAPCAGNLARGAHREQARSASDSEFFSILRLLLRQLLQRLLCTPSRSQPRSFTSTSTQRHLLAPCGGAELPAPAPRTVQLSSNGR